MQVSIRRREKQSLQGRIKIIMPCKDWKCDVCDIEIKLGNKTKHLNTKKHIQNVSHENCEKTWKCEFCNIVINIYSKENHLKSLRHKKNMDSGDNDRQTNLESHDFDFTCSTCDEDE